MRQKESRSLRVPYGLSVHGSEEISAVVKVLRGNTAVGPKMREFERRIAKLFGKRHGVMVNSGSSANLLALELLSLPTGSEIITPLLTFATTVAPIVQKGLIPVFVDVGLETYVVDPDEVERRITGRTRALMIPSLLGNVPDMRRLRDVARRHKVHFIEDSCDTLGATYESRPTGSYSEISTTSFYGSHIINGAGGGGLICVNNRHWAKRLLVLRGWGRQSSLFGEKGESEDIKNRFRFRVDGAPYDAKFIFSEIGYNFLPLEVSAAFALVQLKKLRRFIARRKQCFARLMKFFSSYSDFFILPKQTPACRTVWLAFPLIIRKEAPFSRLEIVTFLEKRNIQTRPVFTGNILKQPGFKNIPRKISGEYPNTDFIMRNAFVVGCHQGLSEQQTGYLEQQFAGFLKRFR
ncbi:MAG: aminotransferase class I/II-fold pyridoxal phosphate-dependent enzyme [Acidobacteria bacterium]|nr:aminotransferase class I/II-fold pyridoxal phosphate-dependent enzyme [Acidobacteriota bacterium]